MGYLEISASGLPSFSKAVISLWFRVPAATLATVSALPATPVEDSDSDGWGGFVFSPPLYKIIPLITFGSLETTLADGQDGTDFDLSPSFIGIDCNQQVFGQTGPSLAVNLQTTRTCSFSKPPVNPEDEVRAEAFYMGGAGYRADGGSFEELVVTPDVVHHILISFDISPSCSITWAGAQRSPPDPEYVLSPGPTFRWAFDDIDKTGPAMYRSGGATWSVDVADLGTTIGDNYIIPQGLFAYFPAAGDISSTPTETSTDLVVTVDGSTIVSVGNPIGIPSSTAFVSNINDVEMAELQIYTGVTLDTSIESNRRAFIKSDGTPETDYTIAATLLGKSPEIKLHGSSLWKAGVNSGTLGGLFTKIGTINTSTHTFDISP